jgi:hypothetical protein
MGFLKLVWFFIRHARVREQEGRVQIDLQGLSLQFDEAGNVQVQVARDLRVNARYVLTQCDPDFDPEAYVQPPTTVDAPTTASCCDHHPRTPVAAR